MKYSLDSTNYIDLPCGVKLYRIKALRDVGNNVKAGDLGGYIESEENLSHEGDCWVCNNAKVYEKAVVYGNARVSGYAMVYDDAEVYGDAKVYGNAEVDGNAMVCGKAWVYGDAEVADDAKVDGNKILN